MEDTFDPHLYFLIMKQKTINMNNDLSIIILTFNRPSEIKKKIQFWNKYNFKIFILDGSKKKINSNIKIGKNIKYFHLPTKSYHDRIFYIQQKIKTKFVKFESDDDYFYPSTLYKGIKFLTENESFSACIGSSYIYSCFKNEVYLNKLAFNQHTITHKDPFERIHQSFKNYSPTLYYSIHTKRVFDNSVKVWKNLKKNYKEKFLLFPEIVLPITTCFLGYIKYLPNIYWLRKDDEIINRIEHASVKKFTSSSHSYEKLFKYLTLKLNTNYFDNFIFSFKNLNKEILELSGKKKFKKNLIYFYKTRSEIRCSKMNYKLTFLKTFIFAFIPSYIKKRIRFYLNINGQTLKKFIDSNKKNKDICLNQKDNNILKNFLIY